MKDITNEDLIFIFNIYQNCGITHPFTCSCKDRKNLNLKIDDENNCIMFCKECDHNQPISKNTILNMVYNIILESIKNNLPIDITIIKESISKEDYKKLLTFL